MIATQHTSPRADQFVRELDTQAESLRITCQELLNHCHLQRDYVGAAVVAELSDMAGSVLLGLSRAAQTHVRQR